MKEKIIGSFFDSCAGGLYAGRMWQQRIGWNDGASNETNAETDGGSDETNETTSGGDSSGNILIGMSASISGPSPACGLNAQQGAELAVKEINEAGGVLGQDHGTLCCR